MIIFRNRQADGNGPQLRTGSVAPPFHFPAKVQYFMRQTDLRVQKNGPPLRRRRSDSSDINIFNFGYVKICKQNRVTNT